MDHLLASPPTPPAPPGVARAAAPGSATVARLRYIAVVAAPDVGSALSASLEPAARNKGTDRFQPLPQEAVGSGMTRDDFLEFLEGLPDPPATLMQDADITRGETANDEWSELLVACGTAAAAGFLGLLAFAWKRAQELEAQLGRIGRAPVREREAPAERAEVSTPIREPRAVGLAVTRMLEDLDQRVSSGPPLGEPGAGMAGPRKGRERRGAGGTEGGPRRPRRGRAGRGSGAPGVGRREGLEGGQGTVVVADTNTYMCELRAARQLLERPDGPSVVVPATVVAELDGLRHSPNPETSYSARIALAAIEESVGGALMGWLRSARAAQAEGGVRIPFLARLPEEGRARGGTWRRGVAVGPSRGAGGEGPGADVPGWGAGRERDGDRELLEVCLAIREAGGRAGEEEGHLGGWERVLRGAEGDGEGGGKRGASGRELGDAGAVVAIRVPGPDAAGHGEPPAVRVVLLTADRALQLSGVLEGIQAMPIAAGRDGAPG